MRLQVATKLSEDLKGTIMFGESTKEQSFTSSSAPRRLDNSHASDSSDSAKALAATMEGGKQPGNSRPGSQSSCGSNISLRLRVLSGPRWAGPL